MPWSPKQTLVPPPKAGYFRRQFGAFDIDNYLMDNAGCAIWLKADAHVGNEATAFENIHDGEKVVGWYNSAHYYADFGYALGYNRPTWHANLLNGKPAISFDQTIESPGNNFYGQALITQAEENYNIYNPSIFLVGRMSSNGSFCGKGSRNNSQRGLDNQFGGNRIEHRKLVMRSYGPQWMAWYNGSDGSGSVAVNSVNGVTLDRSAWHIYSFISHQNNINNLNVDGYDFYSKSIIDNGTFNEGRFCIGTSFEVAIRAEGANCDIAEIILLNFAAPDWVKNNIISYLANKYTLPINPGIVLPADIPARQIATGRQTV